jgi:hypothetical protein
MPKLAAALKNGGSVDVTALLKKNGKLGSAETSKAGSADILELSAKKPDAPPEKMGDEQERDSLLDDAIKLANYVKNRNQEIRDGVEKPIPPGIVLAFMNTGPNLERVARDQELAVKFREIEAKMLKGKKLSSEEMNFLGEHYPDHAIKAKRMEAESEQFSKQLKNCATQEEKDRLVMQVKSQVVSAGKKDPLYVLCMMAAIDEAVKEDREGHNGGSDFSFAL